MLEIYIDADACPVKEEAMHVAERHGSKVFLVSNSWLRLTVAPMVEKIVVSEGADAADDWIAEHIAENDMVITADIPLASRCLKRGAHALGPTGKEFTTANIGAALAMRELNAHLRETGASAGYNPSFTKRDKSQFLRSMEDIIQRIKRDNQRSTRP
ncbi:MAG: YaiI/YqxD family protein [Alphaproteobacteria bacterium]|nr:YaiI/YqxD family protein [Alphaproteobacteria bacterium]